MIDLKSFSSYPNNLKLIIIIPLALLYLLLQNNDNAQPKNNPETLSQLDNESLISKFEGNEVLEEKYKLFEAEGVNRKTSFSKEIIEKVIETANSFLGVPNQFGGTTLEGIDASGLVYISIKKHSDLNFPRTSEEMARYGQIILNPDDLIMGDLVFFHNTYEIDRIITSVGIYLGNGSFINSSSSKGVTISDINDPYYWKSKFFYGTRIFN
tara:strand:- start:1160 stop:1792 length:633 start_codon:yes stop_codon:yes gene_type:complete